MSLLDALMRMDKGAFTHEETAEMKSRNLSKVLGEDAIVKVKGLDSEQYMELTALAIDKKGNTNYGKSYDSMALIIVEGMVEPNLKDAKLQEHFGAATPKELAKMFFKGTELPEIAGKIGELSGFGANAEDQEEEIKN